MKKSDSSNNYGLEKFNEINEKYEININEITDLENISEILLNENKCPNCENEGFIEIKKFKPIDEQLNLDKLDNDFARCSCGKRHIDIVMAHILKIMKEENIELRRFILRNGPTPLLTPMLNNKNAPFIEKKSLIILHPKFTKDIAKKIMIEVSEVKGVIKGDPKDTVGLIDANSKAISYELLAGSDIRSDIVQSPGGRIIINKIQHLSYLEFPPSMENKIKRLWEYIQSKQLSKEEISNLKVLDGTCGNGTLGIFLLKIGVKKVIFNDIWKPSAIMTFINLHANGFKTRKANLEKYNPDKIATGYNFEVYNLSLEELAKNLSKKHSKELNSANESNSHNENNINMYNFDICILDCFPSADTTNFEKIAKSLSEDILII